MSWRAAGSASSVRGARAGSSEGTAETRRRWHNQKYFTWVEQQGKTVAELRAQEDPAWWIAEQDRAHEIDRRIRERRA